MFPEVGFSVTVIINNSNSKNNNNKINTYYKSILKLNSQRLMNVECLRKDVQM